MIARFACLFLAAFGLVTVVVNVEAELSDDGSLLQAALGSIVFLVFYLLAFAPGDNDGNR